MVDGVPFIDPNVEHVGVSRLRSLNATNLRNFQKTLVIQDNDKPLAVLLAYEQFLVIQRQLHAVLGTIEVLTDEEERSELLAGLENLRAGRTRPLSEIRSGRKRTTKSDAD